MVPTPQITHRCISCGRDYPCPYCHTASSFICSTLNGDEDANMCEECLEQFGKDYDAWLKENQNVQD